MGKPVQTYLSKEMEPVQIPELVAAADSYEEIRNERMELTEREVSAQFTLIEAMKKHGLTEYNYETTSGQRKRCYVLPGEPKAKVQQIKDKKAVRTPPIEPAEQESFDAKQKKLADGSVLQGGEFTGDFLPEETSPASAPMTQAAAESLEKDLEETAQQTSGSAAAENAIQPDGLTHLFAMRADMPGVCRYCGFPADDSLHTKQETAIVNGQEPVSSFRKPGAVVNMPKGRKGKK